MTTTSNGQPSKRTKWIIIGITVASIVLMAHAKNNERAEYAANPTPTKIEKEVKFKELVDLDSYSNQEVGAATMGLFHIHCRKVSPAMEAYAMTVMLKSGKERMAEIVQKVNLGRMMVGDEKWCAKFSATMAQMGQ